MIDPLGRVLTQIRDYPTVAALTDRIRGGEPAPGDSIGPPYRRFVVIVRLGRERYKRLPVLNARLLARCYGAGANPRKDAATLAGAVSDAVHAKGPSISPGGIGIWVSFDDGGDGDLQDPITNQPYEEVFISVTAADRLLT